MTASPIRLALVGSGRIDTHHARAIAREVPGARLAAVIDPRLDAATALADELGTLAIARAAIVSVQENRSVTLEEVAR